jgi:hypothetical protein
MHGPHARSLLSDLFAISRSPEHPRSLFSRCLIDAVLIREIRGLTSPVPSLLSLAGDLQDFARRTDYRVAFRCFANMLVSVFVSCPDALSALRGFAVP